MRGAAVAVLVALVAMLRPEHAHADEIGLVISGDPARKDALAAHVKTWLRKRGHEVNAEPLKADAIQTLDDCLAIDDQSCARVLVEKRATTDGVIYALVQATGKKSANVRMYWFTRGKQGASERRGCDKCNEAAFASLADDMLVTLAKSAEQTGRLVIRSRPEDLLVLVDNETVGQTPVERDLSPGQHRVVLTRGGETVAEKLVEIEAGETSKVMLVAHDTDHFGQKLGSIALITTGFGLLVTAGVMISYGSKDGPGEMYVYDNATGLGLISGGIGLLGVVGGALLWPRSTQSATPVATLGPSGGFVGFAGRF